MKVSNVNPINKPMLKEETLPAKSKKAELPAVVYEKNKTVEKVTYDKPGHVYDKASLDKLKIQSQLAHNQLIQLVESLLRRQGKTLHQLEKGEYIPIDEQTRAEANKLISKDGPLGVEAVSDRIVDFAIAISGGDKGKIDKLKAAIDKGFKEAEKVLGSLPEISQKTYKAIMDKLDKWVEEE